MKEGVYGVPCREKQEGGLIYLEASSLLTDVIEGEGEQLFDSYNSDVVDVLLVSKTGEIIINFSATQYHRRDFRSIQFILFHYHILESPLGQLF